LQYKSKNKKSSIKYLNVFLVDLGKFKLTIIKKFIFLFCLVVFSCSSGGDSDNSSDDSNNNTDPIIGSWRLINEEIISGNWDGSCRGCFMEGDSGSPDVFIFTETQVTKIVWECHPEDGSLCSDEVTYGPANWTNIGSNVYSFDGETLPVTFIGNNQMQTPFEGGDITQTWEKIN